MSKRFGAAIATLQNDINYYESERETDPELAAARIEEYKQAIELLKASQVDDLTTR